MILAFLFVITGIYAQIDFISASDYSELVKSDKNVVTVHAGKAKDYTTTHIKGSILVSYKDTEKEGEVKGLMLEPESLAKFFGESGLSDKNTIVLYDEGSQKYSTRVYWLLKYLGAPNVKILHRNDEDFRKARIVLSSTAEKGNATTFEYKVNPDILATISDVESAKDNATIALVDNRKPAEFDGTEEKTFGHIPGAICINHEDLLNESKGFKTKEELKAIAEKAGITPDKTVIFYCQTGIRGAVGFVAFKNILEYPNVKLYDGAIEEWQTRHELVK